MKITASFKVHQEPVVLAILLSSAFLSGVWFGPRYLAGGTRVGPAPVAVRRYCLNGHVGCSGGLVSGRVVLLPGAGQGSALRRQKALCRVWRGDNKGYGLAFLSGKGGHGKRVPCGTGGAK